jgi:integrase
VRPEGAKLPDPKTGELVDFRFLIRLTRVGINYLNNTLIPALCKKAGVPLADVRGNITSHRARSTIASQLYNAREPMTLFELQGWLGHSTPTGHSALREDHAIEDCEVATQKSEATESNLIGFEYCLACTTVTSSGLVVFS